MTPSTNYASDIYVKFLLIAQDHSAPEELTLAELSLILMIRVFMKVTDYWQNSLSSVFQLALTALIKACLVFRHIQISFNISTPNKQASCLIRHLHFAHLLVFSCEELVCCRGNLYNVLGRSQSPAARALGLFSLLCT